MPVLRGIYELLFPSSPAFHHLLFDLCYLVEPSLVAPTLEGGYEQGPHYLSGEPFSDDPAAYDKYVGVIMLLCHPGGVDVVHEGGPDVLELVGEYAHPYPCAAEEHPPL